MADLDALSREFTEVWATLRIDSTGAPEQRLEPSAPGQALEFSLAPLPLLVGEPPATGPHVELGASIGEGGTARVFSGRQLALDRQVAVKMLRRDLRSVERTRALLSEAWVTGALEHPNVVPVYALGQNQAGEPMLVMKRISGTAWTEFVRQPEAHRARFGSATPLEWNLEVLIQVSNAVHFAHSKGIVHRDIKPDNVMIGGYGEVYVVDWGLAVSLVETGGRLPPASGVSGIAGTPGYLAPEMVDPLAQPITALTDVYLLGAVLHEILTREYRHRGPNLYEVILDAYRSEPVAYGPEVPLELAQIANRATARDPRQRFPSADAFRAALVEFSRHRESANLAREATDRLGALSAAIAEAGQESADAARIHRAFGETRFGFEQSLRLWNGNLAARRGIDTALRALASYELGRGAHESAALLIADIDSNKADLEVRLEALQKSAAEKELSLEALKKLEAERDLRVGATARSRLALFLGLAWTIVPIGTGLLLRDERGGVSYQLFIAHIVFCCLCLLAGVAMGGRTLLQPGVNRTVVGATALTFVSMLIHRVSSSLLGVPQPAALSQEFALYALVLGVLGLTADRRLYWAAAIFASGAPLTALFPERVFEITGASNLLALGLVAWLWSTRTLARSPNPASPGC
jgi:serine/threonine-protein kinase